MFGKKTPEQKFEQAVEKIAKQYALDAQDVKNAYASKPESLTTHFNTMSDARKGRNRSVLLGIGVAVVTAPALIVGLPLPLIAAWPGYRAYENQQKLNEVKQLIADEVGQFKQRALPAPKELPPPPPSAL